MTTFYAKSTGGFYCDDIHGDAIPADAVEVSNETYVSLLEAQSSGKIISYDDNGYPILIDNPEPSEKDLIKNNIKLLELKVTERRKREAILTEEGKSWLLDIENQIKILREGL